MNKKQIERHLISLRQWGDIRSVCPFDVGLDTVSKDTCLNKYCGKVFPGWRRSQNSDLDTMLCPCYVLSITYVKRRFRKWLKE